MLHSAKPLPSANVSLASVKTLGKATASGSESRITASSSKPDRDGLAGIIVFAALTLSICMQYSFEDATNSKIGLVHKSK